MGASLFRAWTTQRPFGGPGFCFLRQSLICLASSRWEKPGKPGRSLLYSFWGSFLVLLPERLWKSARERLVRRSEEVDKWELDGLDTCDLLVLISVTGPRPGQGQKRPRRLFLTFLTCLARRLVSNTYCGCARLISKVWGEKKAQTAFHNPICVLCFWGNVNCKEFPGYL